MLDPANVLWISLDCLRADRLGCYGYHRKTSPNIDLFASNAQRFKTCISPHIPTEPAHTTMFSGQDVFAHQIVAHGGRHELDPGVPLLAELLHEQGYFAWAVDSIGRWIRRGFDRYEVTSPWDHDGTRPWRNGEEVSRKGLLMLEQAAQNQPFLGFLHYWDAHSPYLPPPPFDRMFYPGDERDPCNRSMEFIWRSPWFRNYFKEWLGGVTDLEFVRAQYDASIAYNDSCLASIFERLAQPDLKNTLVILVGDHGEELGEHCVFDHHGLYETNLRVPLILSHSGKIRPGVRTDACTLLDLVPTVLPLLGFGDLLSQGGVFGRNLLDLSRVPQEPQATYLTENTWMRKRGWRTGRWKLIEALEPDIYGKPMIELYDLEEDPTECANLAEQEPELVHKLRTEMEQWATSRARATGLPDPVKVQLEALRTWHPRFMASYAVAKELAVAEARLAELAGQLYSIRQRRGVRLLDRLNAATNILFPARTHRGELFVRLLKCLDSLI